jgi:hypothetical protein
MWLSGQRFPGEDGVLPVVNPKKKTFKFNVKTLQALEICVYEMILGFINPGLRLEFS